MLRLIDQIAAREGLGDFLAQGVARMAERLGKRAQQYAMHVKGQELPMHEPRVKHALGVGYALSPTGADHMHNMHDTMFRGEGRSLDHVREFEPTLQPVPATVLNEDKMRLYYYHTSHKHFLDSVIMCHFLPYSPQQMVDLVNAVTGWDLNLQETQEIGRRTLTLARVFNLREGLTAADDTLPGRFFAPFDKGEARKSEPLDRDAFEWAKGYYYELMGWDRETGVPAEDELQRLGLAWASAYLQG
jgi:aldehyde:ferredoxin oxidoreductase